MADTSLVKFKIIVSLNNIHQDLDQIVWEENVIANPTHGMKAVRTKTQEAYNLSLAEHVRAPNVWVLGSYFGAVSNDPPQLSYGIMRGNKGRTVSRHGWFRWRSKNSYATNVDSETDLGTWIHVHNIPSQNKHLLLPVLGDDWLGPATVSEPLKRFG